MRILLDMSHAYAKHSVLRGIVGEIRGRLPSEEFIAIWLVGKLTKRGGEIVKMSCGEWWAALEVRNSLWNTNVEKSEHNPDKYQIEVFRSFDWPMTNLEN